jgi:hypothetical protein
LFALSGCGGGATGGSDIPKISQDPGNNGGFGSIAGQVSTLSTENTPQPGKAQIDFPPRVLVSLRQLNGAHTDSTTTNNQGIYHFDQVPNGSYEVSATTPSHTDAGVNLTNTVTNVLVDRGNPTLGVNLLLGKHLVAFTGTVKQGSQLVVGATVSVSVQAHPFDNSFSSIQIILSTTTTAGGAFTITVPDEPVDAYIFNAHSTTSAVTPDSVEHTIIPPLTPSKLQVPQFVLTTVSNPRLATLKIYAMSSTLPQPTPEASLQAALTRTAVAKIAHLPATSRFVRMRSTSQLARVSAAATAGPFMGNIENLLTWETISTGADDILGYYLYRSGTLNGTFVKIGQNPDPNNTVFSDYDPALSVNAPAFYTVASYAGNGTATGKVGVPAIATISSALPLITGLLPGASDDDSPTVAGGHATLQWAPVAGARGYVVVVYADQPPTFNSSLDTTLSGRIYDPATTVFTITNPPGVPSRTYWWSVSAYNVRVDDTHIGAATAISYSAYRKVTVTQ